MKSEYRIFGSALDRSESYVDVTVSGTDATGKVYFTDKNSDETWGFDADEIQDLHQDNEIIESANVPSNTNLWNVLDSLAKERDKTDLGNFTKDAIESAEIETFRALKEMSR